MISFYYAFVLSKIHDHCFVSCCCLLSLVIIMMMYIANMCTTTIIITFWRNYALTRIFAEEPNMTHRQIMHTTTSFNILDLERTRPTL
jgi:hypothetical protein